MTRRSCNSEGERDDASPEERRRGAAARVGCANIHRHCRNMEGGARHRRRSCEVRSFFSDDDQRARKSDVLCAGERTLGFSALKSKSLHYTPGVWGLGS